MGGVPVSLREAESPQDWDAMLARAAAEAERTPPPPQRAIRQLGVLGGVLMVLFAGIVGTTVTLSPLISSTVSMGRAVLPRLLGAP